MAFRLVIASLAAVSLVVVSVAGDAAHPDTDILSRIPGGRTAAGILSSSANGMSRYFAQDGPIQPALTAIGTVPVRVTEPINRGITRISSGLNNQAQRLSRAAGQNGQISMPGLQTAESHMPESIASLGQAAQNMIGRKNRWIMNQAERGVESANRLGQMMHGMSVRASGPSSSSLMEGPANMMRSALDFMAKSASTLKQQTQQHLNGAMNRMGSMQDIGQGVIQQKQGYARTVQQGVAGAAEQLQQTGQQLMSQVQNNHQKNMRSMSGVLESFQGSMGNMNSNMHKNMQEMAQHAQGAAQQVTSSIQEAAQKVAEAPMKVMASLSSMMGGGASSSGGRGY
jgi:hypothetical protein